MFKDLIHISQILNNDCVFVGSIVYKLIGIDEEVNDIDIVVKDENLLGKLEGELQYIGYRPSYLADRYYIKRNGKLNIDVFIKDKIDFTTMEIMGYDIKYQPLKQQVVELKGIIERSDNEFLIKSYKDKINKITCVQYQ